MKDCNKDCMNCKYKDCYYNGDDYSDIDVIDNDLDYELKIDHLRVTMSKRNFQYAMYYRTEKGRQTHAKYEKSEKGIATRKEYYETHKDTDEYKAKMKRANSSEKGKARTQRYLQTEKAQKRIKAYSKDYIKSGKNAEACKRYREKKKAERERLKNDRRIEEYSSTAV